MCEKADKQHELDKRYLRMAAIWAENSYCKRRQVGALLVKDKMIISDGFNGTPAGFENVCEDETNRTKPYVLHAEANAIINADREKMIGSSLYLACVGQEGQIISGTDSCMMCKRMVINAGISEVFVRDTATEFRRIDVMDWIMNDDSLSVRESGY